MLTTGWHGVLLKASNHVQFPPLKSTWNVTVGIPAWEGRPGGSGSRPGAGMSRAHCCSWRGRATWSLSVDELMAEQQAPGPGQALRLHTWVPESPPAACLGQVYRSGWCFGGPDASALSAMGERPSWGLWVGGGKAVGSRGWWRAKSAWVEGAGAPGARALADGVLLLFAVDVDLDLLAVELRSAVSLGR